MTIALNGNLMTSEQHAVLDTQTLPDLSTSVESFLSEIESRGGIDQASMEDLSNLADLAVHQGLTRESQAGRIRYLAKLGIKVGTISKALQVRYQRAYQVVNDRDGIMREVPDGSVPCAVCGRALTDPEHVKQGIGPICIKQQ